MQWAAIPHPGGSRLGQNGRSSPMFIPHNIDFLLRLCHRRSVDAIRAPAFTQAFRSFSLWYMLQLVSIHHLHHHACRGASAIANCSTAVLALLQLM